MLWVIYSVAKPKKEIEAIKAKEHDDHVAYLKSKDDIIFSAGPLQSDDGTEYLGSLWIINVNTRAEAKAFSDGEAYTKAGLFKSVTITRVRQGYLHPQLAA